MGALQTSISSVMAAGFPGMWYDISDTDAIGRTVEGTIMAFGIAAVQGTHNNQCRVPDSGDVLKLGATTEEDNPFAGLVMAHAAISRTNISTPSFPLSDSRGYLAPQETASLARHGRFWIISETDAKKFAPIFYRTELNDPDADDQEEQLGGWRADDDGGKAIELSTARYLYAAEAGKLAVVELTGAH